MGVTDKFCFSRVGRSELVPTRSCRKLVYFFVNLRPLKFSGTIMREITSWATFFPAVVNSTVVLSPIFVTST